MIVNAENRLFPYAPPPIMRILSIENISFREEQSMKRVFAPGCGLMIYQPHLAKKISNYLKKQDLCHEELHICCRHEPLLEAGTEIINVCAGCHKRFATLYEGITTISLWEILAEDPNFPFPDYQGISMSIQDACPTRQNKNVHKALRILMEKMNITIIEPEKARTKSVCCGDSFYPLIPDDEIQKLMEHRANEMPCEDVVVHCTSCVKSMINGGKTPQYIISLLFEEETIGGVVSTREWHDELDIYIAEH